MVANPHRGLRRKPPAMVALALPFSLELAARIFRLAKFAHKFAHAEFRFAEIRAFELRSVETLVLVVA